MQSRKKSWNSGPIYAIIIEHAVKHHSPSYALHKLHKFQMKPYSYLVTPGGHIIFNDKFFKWNIILSIDRFG